MYELVLVIHVLVVIALVILVMIQNGKGAELGAAFGAGSANSMFGGAGTVSFLVKVTAVLAAIFFITSVALGVMKAKMVKHALDNSPVVAEATARSAVHTSPKDVK